MVLYPNRAQWIVIWTVTALTLGLWLADAPWTDLATPSIAQQERVYDAGASRRANDRLVESARRARRPIPTGLAERLRRDRMDREAARSAAAINQFDPNYRGDSARTTIRNRVSISAGIFGLLLVWQLAGKRRPDIAG